MLNQEETAVTSVQGVEEGIQRPPFLSGSSEKPASPLCCKLSPGTLFAGFSCVIIVRTLLECLLGVERSLILNPDFYYVLVMYSHLYVSWVCIFAAFALLVACFFQISLSESFFVVLLMSPLTITVPFVDYLLPSQSKISYAGDFHNLLHNYFNLFNPFATVEMATTGVRMEVFIASVASFFTCWLYFKKNPVRALAFTLSVYTTIFAFGYLPAFIPTFQDSTPRQFFELYLPVFPVLMLLIGIRLGWENRAWGKAVWDLLFPSRLIFYVLLMTLGMIFTAKSAGLYATLFPAVGGKFSFAVISIVLLFMHAKLQNDVHDYDIDVISNRGRSTITGAMTAETASSFAGIFRVLSFAFAVGAERSTLLLWFLIVALSSLYSEPPLRLRRFYPLGHYILALIGSSVFLFGASLVGSWHFFTVGNVALLTVWVFLSFFFLSHIKDFKDMEGDRLGGVMNVYNLTRFPRLIGVIAVCGFAASVAVVLQIISLYSFAVLAALAVYLAVVITSILRTRDLQRLDWILRLSLVLVGFISVAWLLKQQAP